VEVIAKRNIPKCVPCGGVHVEATSKQQIRAHLHPKIKNTLHANYALSKKL
jgi:hypothetical protein